MNLLQQKTVLKEAKNAFFRTAFCLSAILSKTCFSGRQTKLTEVGIIPHAAFMEPGEIHASCSVNTPGSSTRGVYCEQKEAGCIETEQTKLRIS